MLCHFHIHLFSVTIHGGLPNEGMVKFRLLGLGSMWVITALVQYLSNTEMQYTKIITKPITETLKYRNKIANIAIFSE